MENKTNYRKAIIDFDEARRRAEIREVFARLKGESTRLLSYEDVRNKLKATEANKQSYKEIPLDSIIGSVGRYTDFTRDFLPRRDSMRGRWAVIMEKATNLEGLPPIDVYQIGDAYFVLDGNHRVSVARELKSTHIQAHVTELRTRVPLSPDINPDQLIIKAEQVEFLENTKIDKLCPKADLTVTNPGQYPILEEHISVHQFFMGIDDDREIYYVDAVKHWYEKIYLPVVDIIRERGILNQFPNRTETDLYLWISKHRGDLAKSLGWELDTEEVAGDLVFNFAKNASENISRLVNRILDLVIPDSLESGPSVGHWRQKYIEPRKRLALFENILIALPDDTDQWFALDQGLIIAARDHSHLRGLHVIPSKEDLDEDNIQRLKDEFSSKCHKNGINGELAIEFGGIARMICDRSHWADLIITNLKHPPEDKPSKRIGSGFRKMIRRCPRPIFAVPSLTSPMKKVLLAFNGSPKSEEALYISAYMAAKWSTHLVVLTIDDDSKKIQQIQDNARNYLESKNIPAQYIQSSHEDIANLISDKAVDNNCDLILMGGYKSSPIVEVVQGSIVDEVLRNSKIPMLFCR